MKSVTEGTQPPAQRYVVKAEPGPGFEGVSPYLLASVSLILVLPEEAATFLITGTFV